MDNVPAPLSVELPSSTRYALLPPPPLTWMAPALEMVGPSTVSCCPVGITSVLPVPMVRSSMVAARFNVTVDVPSTMSTL